MKLRVVVTAIGLISLGFAAGRAQTTEPDFELIVNAPEGETHIECVRGCELSWWQRGPNPGAAARAEFTYSCTGSERCSSGRVGGWLRR
jgi:hypothetical protein